jgi:ferritin
MGKLLWKWGRIYQKIIYKHMNEQNPLGFGDALLYLKDGKKVTRLGWNGKGIFLALQTPDENSKMKRPYIYIVPGEEWVVPWVASQADLLSEDWVVVE